MKMKPFKTGVRRLNIAALGEKINHWVCGTGGRSINSLFLLTARQGYAVHAQTIHKICADDIRTINADALHSLLLALGATFESVSDSLDT